MKKNKKIWYGGYLLGAICLFIVLAFQLNRVAELGLIFLFAFTVGVSYVSIMALKTLDEDPAYKIILEDERNQFIRDKVNAMMAPILLALIGLTSVICIYIKAYLPAAILGFSVLLSPLLMYLFSRHYEKKC